MTVDEWERIVLRLNANYPGQQVEPPTAVEWFGPLSAFPVGEVWDAIDVLRRTSDYLPTLKAILTCIDANWRERMAAQRKAQAALAPHRQPGSGVPMPPETKQALELLRRSTLIPGNPDRLEPKTARERIEALADQLTERVDAAAAGRLS